MSCRILGASRGEVVDVSGASFGPVRREKVYPIARKINAALQTG